MGKDPLKLMIIDDNARFRALVRQILTTGDDRVLEMDDGAGVNELYAEFNPDWVLMDVNMKFVNGMDATKQLIQAHPHAKVIFLSNFINKKLIAKGLGLGAKAYVSKEDVFAVQEIIRPQSVITGEHHV